MTPQDLADLFSELAHEIEQFREAQQANLSADEFATLGNTAASLLHMSDQFIGQAIANTLANAQVDAQKIATVTQNAKNAVQTINKVVTVINIATAGVTLGTAILSGNVGQIASAVGGLSSAVGGGGVASAAGRSPQPN